MRTTSPPAEAKLAISAGSSAASVGKLTMMRPARPRCGAPKISAALPARRISPRKNRASVAGRTFGAGAPASAASASEAASSETATRLSSRPSEETPSAISLRCNGRRS